MIRILFVCFWLFSAIVNSWGQFTLYPVRIGHKWGFVSLNPKRGPIIEIEPKYYALSEEPVPWNWFGQPGISSPYQVFEADEKIGLLDNDLNERLPNLYQRIRPLTTMYFAVEESSDSLFMVVDTSGRRVLNARYDDICPLSPAASGEVKYFLVQKGQFWGIHQKKGPLLMPPKYAALEVAYNQDFFKIKQNISEKRWLLVDREGNLLLPDPVYDAFVLHPQLIVEKIVGSIQETIKYPEKKLVWDTTFLYRLYQNGKQHPKNWGAFIPLNRHVAALYSSDSGMVLLHIASQRILKTNYHRVFPMNENFSLAQFMGSRSFQLIDSTGTTVPGLEADSIRSTGVSGIFYVNKNGPQRRFRGIRPNSKTKSEFTYYNTYWGVVRFQPGVPANQLIKNRFLWIEPFQNNLALCADTLGVGMINSSGKEVIPCLYKWIERGVDNLIRAYAEKETVNYSFDEKGEPSKGATIISNSKVISAPPKRSKPVPLGDEAIPAPKITTIPPLGEIAGGQSAWKLNFDKRRWEYRKGGSIDSSGTLSRNVVDVLATDLGQLKQSVGAIYLKNAPARNPAQPSRQFSRMAFFNFETGKLLTPADMVGFRPFQYGCRYTTFIDTSGKMGLIDRNGKQAMNPGGLPIRFTYIGPFRLGRARVCVGGQIRVDTKGDNGVFSISDQNSFFAEFHLRSPVWQQDITLMEPKNIYAGPAGSDIPRWGFIDLEGRILIEPRFQLVQDFHWHDSLALFVHQNKKGKSDYGAIDLRDSVVFTPQYTQIIRHENYYRLEVDSTPVFYFTPRGEQIFTNPTVPKGFSEGHCPLRGPQGSWGYIDTSGQVDIPLQFDTVRAFSEGLAATVDSTGFWVFIDHSGHAVFQTKISKSNGKELGNFRNGRCRFRIGKGECGFYDKYGKERIKADNLWTSDFLCNAAVVIRLDSAKQRTVAIVDTAGRYCLLPQFEPNVLYISPFNQYGVALMRTKKGRRWMCVNTNGKSISAEYDSIRAFVNGYARVHTGNKWGLINAAGRECLPRVYTAIDTVSEGLVAVKISPNDDWFFVDTLNKPAFKGRYKSVNPFQYGVAVVNETEIIRRDGTYLRIPGRHPTFFAEGVFGIEYSDQAYYYADASGNNLFPYQYSEITPFYRGIARVRQRSNARLGVLNRRGMFVLAPKYKSIHLQPDGNFAVNPQRYYGIANRQKKIILPPEYDKVTQLQKGYFQVEQGEKVGYIDKNGNWLFKMQQ